MLFISHATCDDAFVDSLADELAIYGYSTWIDHKDMHGGDKWVAQLEKALADSSALILILSETSVKSPYVEAEWHSFFNLKRIIIPVRIGNCEVPLFLQNFHQISFSTPQHFAKSMKTLIDVIATLVDETQHTHNNLVTTSEKQIETLDENADLYCMVEAILDDLAPTLHANHLMLVLPLEHSVLQFPIDKPLSIGRSHNSLKHQPEIDLKHVKQNALISRQHAILFFQGKQLFVQDLASTNGSFLNGVQLAPHELYPIDNYSLVHFSKSVPVFVRYSA